MQKGAELKTENFECCWCKEFEIAFAENEKTEPDAAHYTYKSDCFSGLLSFISKEPICKSCVNAVYEGIKAQTHYADSLIKKARETIH